MKWILIMSIYYSVEVAEFNTEPACLHAAKKFVEWRQHASIKAMCVPKGMEIKEMESDD